MMWRRSFFGVQELQQLQQRRWWGLFLVPIILQADQLRELFLRWLQVHPLLLQLYLSNNSNYYRQNNIIVKPLMIVFEVSGPLPPQVTLTLIVKLILYWLIEWIENQSTNTPLISQMHSGIICRDCTQSFISWQTQQTTCLFGTKKRSMPVPFDLMNDCIWTVIAISTQILLSLFYGYSTTYRINTTERNTTQKGILASSPSKDSQANKVNDTRDTRRRQDTKKERNWKEEAWRKEWELICPPASFVSHDSSKSFREDL